MTAHRSLDHRARLRGIDELTEWTRTHHNPEAAARRAAEVEAARAVAFVDPRPPRLPLPAALLQGWRDTWARAEAFGDRRTPIGLRGTSLCSPWMRAAELLLEEDGVDVTLYRALVRAYGRAVRRRRYERVRTVGRALQDLLRPHSLTVAWGCYVPMTRLAI